MDILTTKKYRAIDPEKVRPGLAVRYVRTGETTGYTGTIDGVANTSITIGAYLDGTTARRSITLTADQLYQNDYETFLFTGDLDTISSESDIDFTIEKEAVIFDPQRIQKSQYTHWTTDGNKYQDGQVTAVAETQVSIAALGGNTTLKVADAEKPTFDITVSDTLGAPVRWTVIE
jgi:hypothetical protein